MRAARLLLIAFLMCSPGCMPKRDPVPPPGPVAEDKVEVPIKVFVVKGTHTEAEAEVRLQRAIDWCHHLYPDKFRFTLDSIVEVDAPNWTDVNDVNLVGARYYLGKETHQEIGLLLTKTLTMGGRSYAGVAFFPWNLPPSFRGTIVMARLKDTHFHKTFAHEAGHAFGLEHPPGKTECSRNEIRVDPMSYCWGSNSRTQFSDSQNRDLVAWLVSPDSATFRRPHSLPTATLRLRANRMFPVGDPEPHPLPPD